MTQVAIVTFLICAALFVSWLWRPRQAMEPGVWMLLIAYALLGAWALWFGVYSVSGQEPTGFMFWKPTVMYWTLTVTLVVAPLLGWGYPVKVIFGSIFALSKTQWRWINHGIAALCALLGGINLLVAFNTAEGNWVGHKYSTMILLLFLTLFRMSFVWMPTMIIVVIKLYRRVMAFFP